MKRIVSLAVMSALLLGGAFAIFHFSGARGKVVKKDVLDTIDEWLGKEKVHQQELADSLEKANKAVELYFNGRVDTQIQVERLTKNFKPVKTKYEASNRKLDEMIDAVEKVSKDPTVEVSVGGDTKYSQKNQDALKTLLNDQTKEHTAIKTEYNDRKRALEDAERSLTLLRTQEQDARKKVALYEARKKALDAKLDALAKQKEAAKLLKGDKSSADANFDEIEKKLSDLEDHAEGEMRKAEERSTVNAEKAFEASKGGKSLDDVLEAAREARGQK